MSNANIKIVEAPKPIFLDLGCGKNKRDGYIGVDVRSFEDASVDIVCDLGKARWPWEDNSVEKAHCSHMVEHLTPSERIHFVNELYRVLVPGVYENGSAVRGFCEVITPHWASTRAYGDLTHCFAQDTDILAEGGWKRISDIKLGERVHALDLETETTALVPVIGVIDQPYIGPMLHFRSEAMDLLVTPNHDLVWRAKGGNGGYWKRKNLDEPRPILRRDAADSFIGLVGHHPRRGIAILPTWDGATQDRIRVGPDEHSLGRLLPGEFNSGDLAELVGWFVSEGWTDLGRGHYVVSIGQSATANQENYERIHQLIERLGYKPQKFHDRIRFASKSLALYLSSFGLCNEKFVPAEWKAMDKPILLRLLNAALRGDGCRNGNGWTYATSSARLADDIQEIAAKLGFRTSLRVEARSKMRNTINGRFVTSRRDLYMVGISFDKDIWYPQPAVVPYHGRMVCVTLPKLNTIYVRRGGKPLWAGNCWPPVSEFWFFYLNKEWRAVNAPHNDGYTCDFEITSGYGVHEALRMRNHEYVMHALQFWKEAATDMIATFVKRVPK